MNSTLFQACKDLIDDAKTGCVDLVFKEVSLEILARAKLVLDEKEFSALVDYTTERIEEKTAIPVDIIR